MSDAATPGVVHYLPLVTTAVAAVFATVLARRFRARGGAHLGWWAAGVVCYGLGTALESTITLVGNTALLNKAWYAAGAVLGAYPLAQGTAYLLFARRTAHRLTAVTLPVVVFLVVASLLSPVDAAALEPHRPGVGALSWSWIRVGVPLVNSYAAALLIGGAVYSAWRFARIRTGADRARGNALIAVGAILPAVGGGLARAGHVEALYVTELAGLVLIWIGYAFCVRR